MTGGHRGVSHRTSDPTTPVQLNLGSGGYVGVSMRSSLLDRMEAYAAKTGATKSRIVQEALNEWLENRGA